RRQRRHPPLCYVQSCRHPRALPSFPTRRSSDLTRPAPPKERPRTTRRATTCCNGCSGERAGDERRGHVRVPTALARDDRGCGRRDRKSTRLNSSHLVISYAVFCLKKKKKKNTH